MQVSVSKKKKSARSRMLSLVMPLLSSGQGVLMQEAMEKGDSQAAHEAWKKLGEEFADKIKAAKDT